MPYKMLDVGCGVRPKGDVNVDLFFESNLHRIESLVAKNIPNFVCADCHFLPFKDGCFHTVIARYLLEHKGVKLIDASKELLRVSQKRVIIQVPNMFRRSKFSPAHDKIFGVETFNILFRNFTKKIQYAGFDWTNFYFPNRFLRGLFGRLRWFPCPIPTELKVEVDIS